MHLDQISFFIQKSFHEKSYSILLKYTKKSMNKSFQTWLPYNFLTSNFQNRVIPHNWSFAFHLELYQKQKILKHWKSQKNKLKKPNRIKRQLITIKYFPLYLDDIQWTHSRVNAVLSHKDGALPCNSASLRLLLLINIHSLQVSGTSFHSLRFWFATRHLFLP